MSSAEPAGIRISGNASEGEVAAVLAVLAALSAPGTGNAQPRAGRSLWSSRGRAARPALAPGPGVWQGSVLPR
ncbi:hypothetical protein BH23ACT6_BH23ACT6_02410 [soil metagenome]